MAQPQRQRFTPPQSDRSNQGEVRNPFGDENLNAMPKPLDYSPKLREKISGNLHDWNEGMAARSDLVENYWPADEPEQMAAMDHFDNSGKRQPNAAQLNPFRPRD